MGVTDRVARRAEIVRDLQAALEQAARIVAWVETDEWPQAGMELGVLKRRMLAVCRAVNQQVLADALCGRPVDGRTTRYARRRTLDILRRGTIPAALARDLGLVPVRLLVSDGGPGPRPDAADCDRPGPHAD